MEQILNFIRQLGPIKIGIIAVVSLSILGFLAFLTAGLTHNTQMELLYTQLDPSITSKIAAHLNIESISYRIINDGHAILVPSDKVNTLRMELAQNGLSGKIVGYELFDKENAYNSSSFLQRINELRALEGELERTIMSINGILSARVNIVMPRRELFSRTTQKATASVLIRMEGAQRLSSEQIVGIQNLIAGAVPNLNSHNISIVDQRGVLLARGSTDETLEESHALQIKLNIEDNLQEKLFDLLSQMLGANNVSVEVEADLDMTKTTINEENYNPSERVLRSSEEINHHSISRTEGPQPVTVSNNLPNAAAELPQKNPGIINEEKHSEERNNYEISKKLTSSILPVGQIKRLSVAVLVNDRYINNLTNKEPVYQPLTKEEIANITNLIKSAIGFDAKRGDQVSVVNMPFANNKIASSEKTYFGIPVSDIRWMIKMFIVTILAVLILLLLVRPIIKKYTSQEENQDLETMPQLDEFGNVILPSEQTAIDSGSETRLGETMPDSEIDQELEQMIHVKNIEGRIKASSLKRVLDIIEQHPQESLNIIRNWIYNNEGEQT